MKFLKLNEFQWFDSKQENKRIFAFKFNRTQKGYLFISQSLYKIQQLENCLDELNF